MKVPILKTVMGSVLLACLSALPALVVRRVQGVLIQELFGLPMLQLVRIYFKYIYI